MKPLWLMNFFTAVPFQRDHVDPAFTRVPQVPGQGSDILVFMPKSHILGNSSLGCERSRVCD